MDNEKILNLVPLEGIFKEQENAALMKYSTTTWTACPTNLLKYPKR